MCSSVPDQPTDYGAYHSLHYCYSGCCTVTDTCTFVVLFLNSIACLIVAIIHTFLLVHTISQILVSIALHKSTATLHNELAHAFMQDLPIAVTTPIVVYIKNCVFYSQQDILAAMTTAVSLLLFFVVGALGTHDLASTYPFSLNLHDDYTLYWTFDNDAQNITFAVRVRTTGWVGFGLSPNGQMPQSDVVIGWVDGTGNRFDVSNTEL